MKAIINATIYDFYKYKENQYILFDDSIIDVGSMEKYGFSGEYEEVVDIKGSLILPGLIVGHGHMYGAFMRGCNFSPCSPMNFKEHLEQVYWKIDGGLDLDSTYHSGKVMSVDHIKCGVTTLFDHHASGVNIAGTLDQLKKAWVDEAGLRGVFCFETSDRFDINDCISENVNFNNKGKSEKHAAMFGVHASLSVSDETLSKISESIGNIPLHVHIAESLEDQTESIARYGKRIVERFVDFGLVNENSLFAHCVNIDEKEAALMAKYGCTAAINVTSNLNTGNGIPDYRLLKRYGIRTIIGNDSLGTNIASDIRNTLFAMHLRTKSPWWFSYEDILNCVRNSYDYASIILGIKLGRLEKGYKADFLSVDYHAPTEMSENNIWGHIFDGVFNSFHPRNVWCDGQAKLRNYETVLDEEKICAEAKISSKKLWNRIG
ncbi:putative aminohydrolase SsnA [Clostridium sediminicola]|uniref:amidohydrolase family protein n=1 Tax=Clostridium sediminicola TaxID=3114879 RepID=UPI0031F1E7AD